MSASKASMALRAKQGDEAVRVMQTALMCYAELEPEEKDTAAGRILAQFAKWAEVRGYTAGPYGKQFKETP